MLQVHDELVFEVPKADVQMLEIIKMEMEQAVGFPCRLRWK